MSKPDKEVMDVVMGMFEQHGVRHPDSFSVEEIIKANPNVPAEFTRRHVRNRNKGKS